MKDITSEEIEEIAKVEDACSLEEVMRRGMEALERGLDPIEVS